MPFEQQHIRARNITLSAKKQNTFGTAILDADLTQRPTVLDGTAFPSITKTFYSNLSRSNKGHMWPTTRQEIQRATAFQLVGDLTDWVAGWICAFCFGAVTTTGASSPYTHTFKPLQSTTQFPVTTVYFEDTADLKFKMPDLAIMELEISGNEVGPLQFRASMVGSGRHSDGAMAVPASPNNSPVLLLGSDTDFLIGPPAAAVSIKERVRSWTVTISVTLVPHRAPGGGKFASFMRIQQWTPKLQAVISAKDTDDIRTLLINDTVQEVQINTNSGAAAQLNLKFPNIYLSAAQLGTDGPDEVWQLESDDQAILKSGANEVLQATVLNSQATWLVGG